MQAACWCQPRRDCRGSHHSAWCAQRCARHVRGVAGWASRQRWAEAGAHLGRGQVFGKPQQARPPLAAGQLPVHLRSGRARGTADVAAPPHGLSGGRGKRSWLGACAAHVRGSTLATTGLTSCTSCGDVSLAGSPDSSAGSSSWNHLQNGKAAKALSS